MSRTVAFNALALRPGGSGVQTYARHLLAGLASSLDANLVAAVQGDALGELPVRVRPLVRPPASGWRRALYGLRCLGPADLVHGLDVDLPLRSGAPTVATVHDLSVLDVPWAYPRSRVLGERLLLATSIARADELIAVSGFTAERLAHRYRRRATVVPLAAPTDLRVPSPQETARIRAAHALPPEFVLYVGDLGPRKGIDVLAEACRRARAPLILAGNPSSGRIPAGARHLGYVPRAELAALFGSATVVAYPSFYEGFGLPVVEALTCGAAVVSTPVPCLTELLPGAATVVPPRNVDALAAAIASHLADTEQRAESAAAGRRAVARLHWGDTIARTIDVYRSLGL